MRVTLVRHAEVQENYIGKYNGHIDIPLSKNGKNQAKEVAQKLSHVKFDKIYCSDLIRAKQTLEAFEIETDPIYTDKLREKSWGKHEGKSFQEIQEEGIEYIDFEQWLLALDGEDLNSYKERVREYFYETIFKDDCQNILVVTHSGVIKTMLGIVKDLSLEETFSIELPYSAFITIDIDNNIL